MSPGVSVVRNQRRGQGQITPHFISQGRCRFSCGPGEDLQNGEVRLQNGELGWIGGLGGGLRSEKMLVSTQVLEAGTSARDLGRKISEIY